MMSIWNGGTISNSPVSNQIPSSVHIRVSIALHTKWKSIEFHSFLVYTHDTRPHFHIAKDIESESKKKMFNPPTHDWRIRNNSLQCYHWKRAFSYCSSVMLMIIFLYNVHGFRRRAHMTSVSSSSSPWVFLFCFFVKSENNGFLFSSFLPQLYLRVVMLANVQTILSADFTCIHHLYCYSLRWSFIVDRKYIWIAYIWNEMSILLNGFSEEAIAILETERKRETERR